MASDCSGGLRPSHFKSVYLYWSRRDRAAPSGVDPWWGVFRWCRARCALNHRLRSWQASGLRGAMELPWQLRSQIEFGNELLRRAPPLGTAAATTEATQESRAQTP